MTAKNVRVVQVPGKINEVMIDQAGTVLDAINAAGHNWPIKRKKLTIGENLVENPELYFVEDGATIAIVDAPREKEQILFYRWANGEIAVLAWKGENLEYYSECEAEAYGEENQGMAEFLMYSELTGVGFWEGYVDYSDEDCAPTLDAPEAATHVGFDFWFEEATERALTHTESLLFNLGTLAQDW